MKKRAFAILTSITALAMSFSVFGAPPTLYNDVVSSDWYYDAVEYNHNNNLLSGIDSNTFSPKATITENEFIAVLETLSSTYNTSLYIPNYIVIDNNLTREEAVALIYSDYKSFDTTNEALPTSSKTYLDINDTFSWATEALEFCSDNGIVCGRDNDRFAPKDSLTRAEAAEIFKRYHPVLQNTYDSLQAQYISSVEDSKTITPDEIYPVTAITKDSPNVSWNDSGDRVLLLTWNKYPDSYKAGETTTTAWGEVWTFTDGEIKNWYLENHAGVTGWDWRLKKLLGLPPTSSYTHVSSVWVKPEDIIRPAYTYDITKSEITDHFPENADTQFVDWFNSNMDYSYNESAYPWTRLGYTYDWANNGTDFGLSEFLIKENSEVEVEFTLTTDEFIAWLSAE